MPIKNSGKTRQENTHEEFWGNRRNILPRHQPPSPTDGLGSRHTHREMGPHREKEGESIVGRMGRKAADGASWMALQSGTDGKYYAVPPTSESNGWVGEQAHTWGDVSLSREGRRINRRKNGEESSGWGRSDGPSVGNGWEINCRATNLRVQWMGWGAGIHMGRWVIDKRKKEESQSSE